MDRRRGITLVVYLRDHEMPLCVVALVIGEGPRIHGNGLCCGSLRSSVLCRNVTARRARSTEKHEDQADQAEHPSDE